MSAPRAAASRWRLIRARDLPQFRHALAQLAAGPQHDSAPPASALAPLRRAILLPTRSAIAVFRQTLESALFRSGRRALILPALLTREDWIGRLQDALPDAPALLTPFEREVLMERAARASAARARMRRAPFAIRPGLVSEMLRFYDELQRRQRTVRRFAQVLFDDLRVERGTDRGSESLIHQTCFLAFAFLAYERGVAGADALDEHGLRRRLIATRPTLPFDHLVVAVADDPADPRGLWPADFDLLGRLAGLIDVDVVITDELHDAGFRARIEESLPGIEEIRADAAVPGAGVASASPVIVRPGGSPELPWIVHRDREEELREVVRGLRVRAGLDGGELRERTAVVFQRPLPYLYLAREIFTDAGVPVQTFDALPLAGEPSAAFLDLALDVARTGGTRATTIALLRSPLLRVDASGRPLALDDIAALDQVLTRRRAADDPEGYRGELEAYLHSTRDRGRERWHGAFHAAEEAAAIARAMRGFREGSTSSDQLAALSRFVRDHQQLPAEGAEEHARHLRGRAAILGVLEGLADACRRFDDRPRAPESLAGVIRHWIERRTFAPDRGAEGVTLVDAVAARFGEFDRVHFVGLVENEWPERPRRNIFYTPSLLRSLGWPQTTDHARAQQAAFRNLLTLPHSALHLHAFQFEGDAIVATSPVLELARGRPSADLPAPTGAVFADELLSAEPPVAAALDEPGRRWLDLRARRPPLADPRYGGFVGPRPPAPYRVSRVDRYVDCPFKYFAESVLELPDEPDDLSGLSPIERGTLVHTLFESFYGEWQRLGRGTITHETLPEALALFERVARNALSRLPAADRALEEARLLGSLVARGLAERTFELEIEAGGDIVDRRLEAVLEGTFEFPKLHGFDRRAIAVRGKADRIDILRTGELRVVDYKLSRLPDRETSLQIAVYAHVARQVLEQRDGRAHPVTDAMYIAFGDERQTAGRLAAPGPATEAAITARAAAFTAAIERIEAGEYPPSPLRVADCQWCRYSGVCRKEYRGERQDAAKPV